MIYEVSNDLRSIKRQLQAAIKKEQELKLAIADFEARDQAYAKAMLKLQEVAPDTHQIVNEQFLAAYGEALPDAQTDAHRAAHAEVKRMKRVVLMKWAMAQYEGAPKRARKSAPAGSAA